MHGSRLAPITTDREQKDATAECVCGTDTMQALRQDSTGDWEAMQSYKKHTYLLKRIFWCAVGWQAVNVDRYEQTQILKATRHLGRGFAVGVKKL